MSYNFDNLSSHAQTHALALYGHEIDLEGESAWRFSATGERVA
jgi:hypothetical protein